jgi:hypothetical protein
LLAGLQFGSIDSHGRTGRASIGRGRVRHRDRAQMTATTAHDPDPGLTEAPGLDTVVEAVE